MDGSGTREVWDHGAVVNPSKFLGQAQVATKRG